MHNLSKLLRSHRTAIGVEHAFLASLIAFASTDAVGATGGKIRDLFGGAGGDPAVVHRVEAPGKGGGAGGHTINFTVTFEP